MTWAAQAKKGFTGHCLVIVHGDYRRLLDIIKAVEQFVEITVIMVDVEMSMLCRSAVRNMCRSCYICVKVASSAVYGHLYNYNTVYHFGTEDSYQCTAYM